MIYHQQKITANTTLDWVNGNNLRHIGDGCLDGDGLKNVSFIVGAVINTGTAGAGDLIIVEGTVDNGTDIVKLGEYPISEATTAGDMLLIPIENTPLRAVRLRFVVPGITDMDIDTRFYKRD